MEKKTSLSRDKVLEIMKDMVVETYSKGTILLRQGEVSDFNFIMLRIMKGELNPEGGGSLFYVKC
ncbi:hypothetical protein [Clostridium aciditolerans]|uniref:Cyclic nucleotide-binding domain-containing protein n=1 Tax=Clostridium aciditolerans TaxID=339861 RepID=A0A934I649_9CLOT|nr:hypothetical protein [Clostridium aciditolerans]MBI6875651.1 hypothetical protein [Clostridium aciditolerans]